ncbi:MAG: preprotein translocase subunit SecG [Pseudomonadota bacterium]
MAAVVLTIHLLLALALIVVVLLQRSEGGGLGIGGGGGGGVMTGRGAATALSKLTWLLGAAFVVTSLTLTIFAARDAAQDSVIGVGTEDSAPAPTSLPQLGDDLLPQLPQTDGPAVPPSTDGPSAPPAAE